MGRIGDAWAGVRRHIAARPWPVRVYVVSVLLSPLLLLTPEMSLERSSQALLHLLLLVGVWAGMRFAWGLSLALLSASFLMGVVATGGGFGLILLGLLAFWIGLLVAAPTQRWVNGSAQPPSEPGDRPRTGRARYAWRSRPVTLRVYVATSLACMAVSLLFDPGQLPYPALPAALVSLGLLLLLWNGSAGMWWLSVIGAGVGAALSLAAASEHPVAWVSFASAAFSLTLLVHPSTRAWFNERIAERYP